MSDHNYMTQGEQANNNGKTYEAMIASTLTRRKYVPCAPGKPGTAQAALCRSQGRAYFQPQARAGHLSIYGTPQTADFYLWHPQRFRDGAVIEVKYQAVSGSVDEKYPYTIACLKAIGLPVFLVLGGGGAKPAAIEWCLAQACDQLVVFRDWSAFDVAANRGMFG